MKEFADDNLKFDENGRKVSKRVENTVGKEEIAHNEQFSFFHSVLKKLVVKVGENPGLVWERVKTSTIEQYTFHFEKTPNSLPHNPNF